jgi:hypothetical protein
MLKQQEEVRNPPGAALFDELSLQFERVGVGNDSESPNFDGPAEAGHYRR